MQNSYLLIMSIGYLICPNESISKKKTQCVVRPVMTVCWGILYLCDFICPIFSAFFEISEWCQWFMFRFRCFGNADVVIWNYKLFFSHEMYVWEILISLVFINPWFYCHFFNVLISHINPNSLILLPFFPFSLYIQHFLIFFCRRKLINRKAYL